MNTLSSPLEIALAYYENCDDLIHRSLPAVQIDLIYFAHLIDKNQLHQDVVEPLMQINDHTVDQVLQQTQYTPVNDESSMIEAIARGNVIIIHGQNVFQTDVFSPATRDIQHSETESVITGPHDSFVESINHNLSLIRKRLQSPRLKAIKLTIGNVSRSTVFVLYIENVANPQHIELFMQRIQQVEGDNVYDANMLVQQIDDNPKSIFPQYLTTEIPDVFVSKLMEGKIGCLVDSSSTAVTAPTSFFEFFASPDDYYQRWILGTSVRILRFAAFVITVSFTAIYVAVTTFHYEMIPSTLLINLAESRDKVPFPPLFEAILMELTIELLREAGARLPAKIGQTIGIVGGIVIGQAAVQAGLTSNILIIAVASSAIASFVIPSYVMSASIRLIRFGLILLAGVWGMLGLIIGLGLIVIHLCGLTNLNVSYLTPLAPMQWSDWKDTFIRGPFRTLKESRSETMSQEDPQHKMNKQRR